MTDNINDQQDAAGGIDGASEGDSTGDVITDAQESTGSKLSREAARYRVERNSAREALAAAELRVAQMQTAELERVAGELLSSPGDLLALAGRDLSEFITDDGVLDVDYVREVAAEVLAGRPGLRKSSPAYDPSQTTGGVPKSVPANWAALFAE